MSDEEIQDVLEKQYRAVIAMHSQAIGECPDSLWVADHYHNRTWHIAYHAIFYTHFYLHPSDSQFEPWPKHRPNAQFLGATPWPPYERPVIQGSYTRAEVLECCEFCLDELKARVRSLDMRSPSGFPWLPFSRMELHLYNIRHLQHHAGQLIDRLRTATEAEFAWIGTV